MDQLTPQSIEAAVHAAGIAMIYNAEDWQRVTRTPASNDAHMRDVAANDPSASH